jgi:hypothetical protein
VLIIISLQQGKNFLVTFDEAYKICIHGAAVSDIFTYVGASIKKQPETLDTRGETRLVKGSHRVKVSYVGQESTL